MDASTVTSVPAWGGREVRDEHPQSGGDCNRGRLLAPSSAALAAGGGGGGGTGADLQVTGSASLGSPAPTQSYWYTYQVKNSGPQTATSNVMTTAVPAGETLNWAQLRNYA